MHLMKVGCLMEPVVRRLGEDFPKQREKQRRDQSQGTEETGEGRRNLEGISAFFLDKIILH